MPFDNPEAIKRARRDAMTVVLHLDAGDGVNDWVGDFERAAHLVRSFVIPKEASHRFAELIIQLLGEGLAVAIEDQATFVTELFIDLGEDRQAMMLGAIEGLTDDRDRYFDRDDPAKDPLYGLNDSLTAVEHWRGGSRQ